jgi:hypothetical protein
MQLTDADLLELGFVDKPTRQALLEGLAACAEKRA